MPTYIITAPDGKEYEVDAPEGASQQDALNYFKRNWQPAGQPKPQKRMSDIETVLRSPIQSTSQALGGLGEAALTLGTGTIGSVVGGLRGVGGLLLGESLEDAVRALREIQEGMTYQPRLRAGQQVLQGVSYPMEQAAKGLGYVGGKAGGLFGPKGEAAGQTLGEIALPTALTFVGGTGALKSAKGVKAGGAISRVTPEPVARVGRSIRDVKRARTAAGKKALAEDYLRSLTSEKELPQTISALERRASPVVPGSPVTSADAIARANREALLKGRPERFGGQYVALQEGLSKLPETSKTLTDIKLLQEKARADILSKGAGTEQQYAAALATRAKAAARLYSQVEKSKAIVDTSKTLNIINEFSKKKAGNKQLMSALDSVKSSLFDAEGTPHASPGVLQSSIENINNLLRQAENKPPDISRRLVLIKKSLEHQINKVEQAQGLATKTFAEKSVPLNQMDLWRAMKEKFISPKGDESPGSYLRILRDQQKLIKDATGFRRGTGVEKIFNTEQSSLAAKMAAEMEMELLKKRIAGEVNIKGLGKAAEGLEPRLPNMLMRETMVANFILQHLARDANVGVNQAAARILADPKMLSGVLKQIKPTHRSQVMKIIKDAAISKPALMQYPVQAEMANTMESSQ